MTASYIYNKKENIIFYTSQFIVTQGQEPFPISKITNKLLTFLYLFLFKWLDLLDFSSLFQYHKTSTIKIQVLDTRSLLNL